MAKHGPYDREEYGQEQHIDASEGYEGPDIDDADDSSADEVPRANEAAQKFKEMYPGLDAGHPEFDTIASQIEDEEIRKEVLRQGLSDYHKRTAEEHEKRARARQHASAAVRIKQGLLNKEYEAHSKRVLGINLVPGPGNPNPPPTQADLRSMALRREALRRQHREYDRLNKLGPPPIIVDSEGIARPARTKLTRKESDELERLNDALDSPVGGAQQGGFDYKVMGEDEERERLQKLVGHDFPDTDEPQGLRATRHTRRGGKSVDIPEDIESTIGEHGQEEQLNPIKGWKATAKFNKDQLERKYRALQTGESALGFGERGKSGYGMGVPVEKAKVTWGPNQTELLLSNEWEPIPTGEKNAVAAKALRRNIRRHKGRRATTSLQDPSHINKTYRTGVGIGSGRPATSERLSLDEQNAQAQRLDLLEHPEKYSQDTFKFKLKKSPVQQKGEIEIEPQAQPLPPGVEGPQEKPRTYPPAQTLEGQSLRATLDNAGFRDLTISPASDAANNTFTIVTHQGHHLNPDQIAGLQAALHINHGLDNFEEHGTMPMARNKRRVPVGYSKLPKDFDNKDDLVPGTGRKNLYEKRFGTHFGERDPANGNLLEGQADAVGLRVGRRAAQIHLGESTDAVGWGRSWRPGETEISNFMMAIPRARQQRELAEAYDASLHQDDSKMNAYLSKYYPDDEGGEREEHRTKLAKESAELASAGFGAAYYSTKKAILPRSVNFGYAHLRKTRVGKRMHADTWRGEGGLLMKDANFGYRRPLGAKIERAKMRIKQPLGSVRYDPKTRKNVVDPTVPGITNEGKLNLPSWKYRAKPFVSDEEYEARRFERKLEHLKGTAAARIHVQEVLSGKEPASRPTRWVAKRQAKAMLWDVHNLSNEGWKKSLETLRTDVRSHLPAPGVADEDIKFDIKKEATNLAQTPRLKTYLLNAEEDIENMLEDAKKDPTSYTREGLRNTVEEYLKAHPNRLPSAVGTAGKATVYGGLAIGGGLLAVDRYQQFKQNKGQDINHPVLKAVVPARIAIPKLKVKRTASYVIPDNAFTNALDFEGEKVPIAGRIAVVREEKVRLREHRDISGEPYKKNLPLFGGIGVRSPAPVKTSVKKGVVHQASSSQLGPTKNMYVSGKKVPIDISYGRKERWQDKNHMLKAKYNPYKLDQEDREHLVTLAQESPQQAGQINAFYHGDDKLQSMLDDKTELDRIAKKNMYWKQGGSKTSPTGSVDDIKGTKGVGVSMQSSRTMEQYIEQHKADSRARRDKRNKNRWHQGQPLDYAG